MPVARCSRTRVPHRAADACKDHSHGNRYRQFRRDLARSGDGQASFARPIAWPISSRRSRSADRAGLDVFGIGEHHRAEFLDSAPAIILAAAAARTSQIRLTSAVTVLSAADPVRIFQEFATLDLIARGRAEIIVGRGSFGEAYPLFGMDPRDYDELFAEKLGLLLKLNETTYPIWKGRFRAALEGQGVYPRPHQPRLPLWVGVGGTPQSFARAGTLGLPLMVAIIGGTFERFRPLVDLYREIRLSAGHSPDNAQGGRPRDGLRRRDRTRRPGRRSSPAGRI